jgi:hydrogenase expression/formation protein HypC
MCLGIPGRVVETYEEHGLPMGRVDFGGVTKRVCLAHTPDAGPGRYVIVHVGFALQVVDEEEARQVFQFLDRIGELEDSIRMKDER